MFRGKIGFLPLLGAARVTASHARLGAAPYFNEHAEAAVTKRVIEDAGRKCVLVAGDVSTSEHCRNVVQTAVEAFGQIDVLVNNAAHQMRFNATEVFRTTSGTELSRPIFPQCSTPRKPQWVTCRRADQSSIPACLMTFRADEARRTAGRGWLPSRQRRGWIGSR
jgi:NAD(P)-dependent dehydrogenase (short-subunit alcohol dehydrogenase family)